MQLADVYDYVPVRVAASDGDVGQWVLVMWAIIDLYRTVVRETLDTSRIESPVGGAAVLVVATVVFTYFAFAGLLEDGLLSVFISARLTDSGPGDCLIPSGSLLVQDRSDDQQRDCLPIPI